MRLVTLLLTLITQLLDYAKRKAAKDKQEHLDNERDKAADDPAGYANDRFLRKPAPDNDVPSDPAPVGDRRDER